MYRLCWHRVASPAPLFEQAFEILTSGDPQSFAIDAPEQPQAKWRIPCQSFASANKGSTHTLRLFSAF